MTTTTFKTEGGSNNEAVYIAIGILIPVLLIFLIVLVCYFWRKRKDGTNIFECLPCVHSDSESTRQLNGTTKFVPKSVHFLGKDIISAKKIEFMFDISEQQHSTSSNGSINLSSSVFKRAQIFPLEFIDVSNTLGKGAYGKVTQVRK